MTRQILAVICITCAAGALVVAPAASPAATPTGKEISELIAREKFIKEQFEGLKTKMLELATLYEKSAALPNVPDTERENQLEAARVFRAAVAQAEAAGIAKDMISVADLLDKDEATAALDAKDKVIKNLKKVLRTMTEGPELDFDKIDEYTILLGKIDKILGDQKTLERQSRRAKDRDANDQAMADLSRRLAGLIGEQKNLMTRTGQLSQADWSIAKLDALRNKVRELIIQQTKIQAALPGTPVAKLSVPAKAQENLAGKTSEVRKDVADAQKDVALVKALFEAGADEETPRKAAEALALACNEMKKASDALNRSSKTGAAKGQEQALVDLKTAERILSEAISKMSDGSPAGDLGKQQVQLGAKTEQFGRDVRKAAENAGMEPDAGDLSDASGAMSDAADKLGAQNKQGAEKDQAEALKHLERKKRELDDLRRRMDEESRKPTDEQAEKQDKLAKEASRTSDEMKSQKGRAATPGRQNMDNAAKSMKNASGSLSQGKSGSANSQQQKAVKELKEARKQLADTLRRRQGIVQAEALAKIDAMLEKILKAQQTITEGTTAAYSLRDASQQYARTQQLTLRKLSAGEGKLVDEIQTIRKLLAREGTTIVFPSVLKEVQQDVRTVESRLGRRQAGTFTQGVQKSIEQSLQEMIDAIRKELSNRRRNYPDSDDPTTDPGPSPEGRKPLVPRVAELKLLRSLQVTVNKRTRLLADEKAKPKPEMGKEQLSKEHKALAGREDKIKSMALKVAGQMKPR